MLVTNSYIFFFRQNFSLHICYPFLFQVFISRQTKKAYIQLSIFLKRVIVTSNCCTVHHDWEKCTSFNFNLNTSFYVHSQKNIYAKHDTLSQFSSFTQCSCDVRIFNVQKSIEKELACSSIIDKSIK